MNGFDHHTHPQQTTAGASTPLLPGDPPLTPVASSGSSVQTTDFAAALNQALAPASAAHHGGLDRAQDRDPNGRNGGLSLVKLGQQFDTISQQLGAAVGDLPLNADFKQVFTGNQDQVLNALGQVQHGLNDLLDTHPQQFQGVAGVKLHVMANQIELERGFIQQGGVSSALGVRDVQRDILDIVNNDTTLSAAANQKGQHGFTSLTPLQNPPQPFQDNDAQTQFLNQSDQTLNHIVQQISQLRGSDAAQDHQPLVQQIRAFDQTVSQFAGSQGGVYSARFNNELAQHSTNETASHQLIKGLETHNHTLITAAESILLANMGDVGGNQIPVAGGSFPFAANAGA